MKWFSGNTYLELKPDNHLESGLIEKGIEIPNAWKWDGEGERPLLDKSKCVRFTIGTLDSPEYIRYFYVGNE